MTSTNDDPPRDGEWSRVRFGLASPTEILGWSFGEVKRPETINFRTYRPEKDGLFCERIFGPEKDWECACGKYRGMTYKGMICDRCSVEVTHSRVRRMRMGHIELAEPIVHTWYRGRPNSLLPLLLGIDSDLLEEVILYRKSIVIQPGPAAHIGVARCQILEHEHARRFTDQFGSEFQHATGAASIEALLADLDLRGLVAELKVAALGTRSRVQLEGIQRRRRAAESLIASRGDWRNILLRVVPVIPPDLHRSSFSTRATSPSAI